MEATARITFSPKKSEVQKFKPLHISIILQISSIIITLYVQLLHINLTIGNNLQNCSKQDLADTQAWVVISSWATLYM